MLDAVASGKKALMREGGYVDSIRADDYLVDLIHEAFDPGSR
jgi:hypothetical protein